MWAHSFQSFIPLELSQQGSNYLKGHFIFFLGYQTIETRNPQKVGFPWESLPRKQKSLRSSSQRGIWLSHSTANIRLNTLKGRLELDQGWPDFSLTRIGLLCMPPECFLNPNLLLGSESGLEWQLDVFFFSSSQYATLVILWSFDFVLLPCSEAEFYGESVVKEKILSIFSAGHGWEGKGENGEGGVGKRWREGKGRGESRTVARHGL